MECLEFAEHANNICISLINMRSGSGWMRHRPFNLMHTNRNILCYLIIVMQSMLTDETAADPTGRSA